MDKTGTPAKPGILKKIFALGFGAVLLVVGFLFSVVLLSIVAVIGLAAFAYFWWKTRALRKAMREETHAMASAGSVIEGEARVVEVHSGREMLSAPRAVPPPPPGSEQ